MMSMINARLAVWLQLAAAPTFALMALLAAGIGQDADAICASANASPLDGMTLMYFLMSVFHLTAWLRLHDKSPEPQSG